MYCISMIGYCFFTQQSFRGRVVDLVNPCNDGGAVESASQEINEETIECHTSLAIQRHVLNGRHSIRNQLLCLIAYNIYYHV